MLYFFRCANRLITLPGLFLLALFALGSVSSHAQSTGSEAIAAKTASVTTVNINTADAATLARMLNGVGQSRAEEIVRYREAFGPFETVDELAEVKGIGLATVDRNRALIVLE